MNLRDVDEAVVAETMERGWDRSQGEAAWLRQRLRWPYQGHGFGYRADGFLSDAVLMLCFARSWRMRGDAMCARRNAAAFLADAAACRRAAVINRQIARQRPELA